MNAPDSNRPQSWGPDAIQDALAAPAIRHLTAARSTFDTRLDALEHALRDPAQSASLPGLILALADAAGDEAEASMKQACLDVRREADRIVGELQHAVDSLRLELDRERLAHAKARTAALQAEQRMSDLETRAVEHEAVRVQLEQARHAAEVDAATAIEELARERFEQNAAHARAVAEQAAEHAQDLAERDAAHAHAIAERDTAHARALAERDRAHSRALAERDAAHNRALAEGDAKQAAAVAVLEQRLAGVETDARARVSMEDQARRRLENQYREVEGQLAVMSRERDRLASETAQLRLEIEVMRRLAGAGGESVRGASREPPTERATATARATVTAKATERQTTMARETVGERETMARTPVIESAITTACEDPSSSVFSSVADALRAWTTESDASPHGLGANSAASRGPGRPPRREAHPVAAEPSPAEGTLSQPVQVRIGRDTMQMVGMTRGGGEVVTPIELAPGRQVKLVFVASPNRTAVTAHVSWCRLEPPSAGDGMLHYRAGLSFELDPETFDRLTRR